MIPYLVGKLASNSSHSTRGLVKCVPGRSYFRAISSQNVDKFVKSPPPPQSLNGSFGHKCSKTNATRSISDVCDGPGLPLSPRLARSFKCLLSIYVCFFRDPPVPKCSRSVKQGAGSITSGRLCACDCFPKLLPCWSGTSLNAPRNCARKDNVRFTLRPISLCEGEGTRRYFVDLLPRNPLEKIQTCVVLVRVPHDACSRGTLATHFFSALSSFACRAVISCIVVVAPCFTSSRAFSAASCSWAASTSARLPRSVIPRS